MKIKIASLSLITLVIASCAPALKKNVNPSKESVTTSDITTKATPPKAWDEWAIWADNLHSTSDHSGHGPDVGSDEWASALDHQLKIGDDSGHGPDLRSNEWRHVVERVLLKK